MQNSLENKVNKFLYVINTMIDGLTFSDIPNVYQTDTSTLLKFEIKLEYDTITGFWSPTEKVVNMITECISNNFNLYKNKIEWNNTKTLFWFYASNKEK